MNSKHTKCLDKYVLTKDSKELLKTWPSHDFVLARNEFKEFAMRSSIIVNLYSFSEGYKSPDVTIATKPQKSIIVNSRYSKNDLVIFPVTTRCEVDASKPRFIVKIDSNDGRVFSLSAPKEHSLAFMIPTTSNKADANCVIEIKNIDGAKPWSLGLPVVTNNKVLKDGDNLLIYIKPPSTSASSGVKRKNVEFTTQDMKKK